MILRLANLIAPPVPLLTASPMPFRASFWRRCASFIEPAIPSLHTSNAASASCHWGSAPGATAIPYATAPAICDLGGKLLPAGDRAARVYRRHRLSVCLHLPIERRQRRVNAGLGVEISRRYVIPRHVGVQGGA